MRIQYDLGNLEWTVTGWTPYVWQQQPAIESGLAPNAEVTPIPASVPGSVQGALRAAGIIPDWNVGLRARECEWVENRHWMYGTRLPDEWVAAGSRITLHALGLDYKGWIVVNGMRIATFEGSFAPVEIDLSFHLRPRENTLQIVFDTPPRWLGQIGYTSQMREWKPRFNYFWDWTSRLVQIGIWDRLMLDVSNGDELRDLDCRTSLDHEKASGSLYLHGSIAGANGAEVLVSLEGAQGVVYSRRHTRAEYAAGIVAANLGVAAWWPNGQGRQPLYRLTVTLVDGDGNVLDQNARRIGFKSLEWQSCDGASPEADPWLAVVNGRPIFLQGVNWTPIRPNFADVSDEQYRKLLETYRYLGCTMVRVWGGAFLEKEVFYDLCDELGILVWQEFPLSSSGLDNWPPDDESTIASMAAIAATYVKRRRHHVSLALWCGGNELQGSAPADLSHPMLARLASVVDEHDPQRRFVPTSPSGPSFTAEESRFGEGVHWDVHGPWRPVGELSGAWTRYWAGADALFHSEIGAPGASSPEVIWHFKGDESEVPGTQSNPLWRPTGWWIEWDEFVGERGREPRDLEEYVDWSQDRQARALEIAARSARSRFPRCGGFLIWMGHDSFPCTANTSILDYYGNPKPAANAVAAAFHGEPRAAGGGASGSGHAPPE